MDVSGNVTRGLGRIPALDSFLSHCLFAFDNRFLMTSLGHHCRSVTVASVALFGILLCSNAKAQTTATPVLIPPNGTSSATQFNVTLTDTTPGATIYYTTNGSAPTTSSSSVASGGSVLIAQTTTQPLQAMAAASGYANSAVASASYQVTGQVAAGLYHTIALRSDGSVWAWGYNNNGQNGDGTTTQSNTAEQVISSGITAVAAGAYHSLALKSNGTVLAWGLNSSGQCGDNTTTQRTSPVQVLKSNGSGGTTNLNNIVAIAAGQYHNLALDSSGQLWAWGLNSNGQLGDGGTTQQNLAEPLTLPTFPAGVKVAAVFTGGYHSFLLTTVNTVYAWGLNTYGELGDGTQTQRNSPVLISFSGIGSNTIVDLTAESVHSMALASDGTVWVWGSNTNGELGDGTTTQRNSPTHLTSLSGIVALQTGSSHSLAIKSDGSLWGWGTNSVGELGDGTEVPHNIPEQILPVSNAEYLAAGNEDSLILKTDGTISGFGANNCGQLGDGLSMFNVSAGPILRPPSSVPVRQISGGCNGDHTLAVDDNGAVWSWGCNSSGQLGDGTYNERISPVPVSFSGLGSATITAVAANCLRSLALDSNATVWSWGAADLGNGSTSGSNQPVHLTGLSGITAITEGNNWGLALDSSGHVWSWGANGYGQLGDNTTTTRTSPVEAVNYSGGSGTYLSGVTAISAGQDHSLALIGGAVYAWGYNNDGQLGDGTTTTRLLPVAVTGLSGVTIVAICAGYEYSAALDSNGYVWTWGANGDAQLGNNGTTNHSTPAQVNASSGYLSNVVGIACNRLSCFALKNDGTVWGWGEDHSGDLGNGTQTTVYVKYAAIQVPNVSGVSQITNGHNYSTVLKLDGSLQSWGYDYTGAVGTGTNYTSPFTIPGFNALSTVPTPTGSITAPSNNASVNLGSSTNFTSSASETGGTIASVGYYINGNLLSTSTGGGSFTFNFAPTTWGNFSFYAIAKDTSGNTSYLSSPITVPVPYTGIAVTPVFSPGAGTYNTPINVSISCLTPRATIFYTTDGSTPTTSSASMASGGMVTVASTETIKAIAVLSGFTNSAVASAAYTIQVPAATPTFSPAAGTYTSSQSVAVSSATSGATIYYTTNGSTPTIFSSSVASGGTIAVASSETIKAMAIATGYNNSAVASASYTIQVPAATPTFSPTAGTYTTAQTVTLSSSTSGATIYYTTDGSTPTTGSSSTTSGGTVMVAQSETLKAMAVASGYNNSALASASYTIQVPAATPTFSPAAGTYASSQTVTLSSATTGATIFYTTDGATPTTISSSVTSGGTITVAASETLKAIATATGFNNSAVASASYTIQVPAATPTFSLNGGTYMTSQSVTVSSTTSGATIYYTTDGSTPTTSSFSVASGGTISVTQSETLKLMAVATGYNNSSVSSESFTIIQIALKGLIAGGDASFSLKTDNSLKAWGNDLLGQLGLPAQALVNTPTAVGSVYAGVSTRGNHTLFLHSDNTVWAVGENYFGQLGTGNHNDLTTPQQIGGLASITAVATGSSHSLALQQGGTVLAWGGNYAGQLGLGTATDSLAPTAITGLTGVTAIAAGRAHSLALANGYVYAWGDNSYGQLGNGTRTKSTVPVPISGLSQIVAIGSGDYFSWALGQGGTVYVWGANSAGQLALGHNNVVSTPQAIGSVSNVAAVVAGAEHLVILSSAGAVSTSGANFSGQLGTGDNVSYNVLKPVLTSGITQVTAGFDHTLALKSDGSLSVFGANNAGQLGNGSTQNANSPTPVGAP